MNIKKQILEASRLLFNEKGVMNTTLRDVAKSMNKSYGNITYHFQTKEDVLFSLLDEMNKELIALQEIKESENLLLYFFNLPNSNYSISLEYLFFILDHLELKRNYPALFKKINVLNDNRKGIWMKILLQLKELKYFDEKVTNNDLQYIMFLSYSLRVTYFQTIVLKSYNKSKYTLIVTNLLKPYLSKKGYLIYENWLESLTVSK